jgi:hypothetical protein
LTTQAAVTIFPIERVDGSDHSAATVAFAKAVHLVEMLLAKWPLAHLSGSHTKRNQLLKTRFVTI